MSDPVGIDVPVGVIRYDLSFDGPPEMRGNLNVRSPQMDAVMRGEAIANPVVAYCLDAKRLRSLLELAQAGNDVDDLMLSVDAAALEPHTCVEDEE